MKFKMMSEINGVTKGAIYETVSTNTPFTYRNKDNKEERFIDDDGDVMPLDVFDYIEILDEGDKEHTHPLVNPESKHYEMIGGKQSVEYMELMFTHEEMMSWAKVTAMKYRLRIGNKDEPSKEVEKIRGYEAYYKYLEEQE